MNLIQISIDTIGTLHPGATALIRNGLYFDVGGPRFRNPHDDPAMRHRTGLDPEVRDHVLGTDGVMQMVEEIAESAKAILTGYADPRRQVVNITIACRGGRHRSVAVAESVASYLRADGFGVDIRHQHIDQPVIENQ